MASDTLTRIGYCTLKLFTICGFNKHGSFGDLIGLWFKTLNYFYLFGYAIINSY